MRSNAESFEYKELGECLELIIDHRGKTPRKLKSDWVSEGVPTISAKNVNGGKLVALDSIRYVTYEVYEKWMKEDVKAGDCFLVSEGATLGECLYWDSDYPIVLGQRIFCIRTNPDILNPRYFYAYMTSPAFQSEIIARATGSSVPGLRQTEVLKLKVKIAPLDHQEKIGNLVYSINKKIAQNKLTNQTLEHIAQALFKSWFVDFEPTRAKIAAMQGGQDPERAAMAAISGKTVAELDQLDAAQLAQLKTTAALFPDGLVESELGEVPEGWEVKSFGNCLSKTIGGDWGRDEPDQKHTKKVKILRGTDLPAVYSGSDEKVPIRFVEAKKLVTRKLFAGDIVIEVSGGSKNQPTGRSLFLTQEVIDRLGCELAPASFCRLFRPVTPEVGLILGLHLRTIYDAGKTWLYQNQSTGISNFQTKVFLEKELVAIPPEKLQKYFAKNVMPLLQKLSSCENQRLEQLRDTLLPKLLSGELSPTQAEVA